ncbi:hypothetical protein D3C71_78560 [compost metagenome]
MMAWWLIALLAVLWLLVGFTYLQLDKRLRGVTAMIAYNYPRGVWLMVLVICLFWPLVLLWRGWAEVDNYIWRRKNPP